MRECDLIRYIQKSCAVPVPAGDTGIGDDACIWHPQAASCLSVDAIIEDTHFTANDNPRLVGRKAAAAALSDLAAMGAQVQGAALVYYMADGWDHAAVIDGFTAELQRHDCVLYGGDTVAADKLSLSVTVWGQQDKRLVMRTGAQIGDMLLVTGALGGSFTGGRHLTPTPRLYEGQWLAAQNGVHAMMDLSDGLASDVRKMCEQSLCGCLLYGDKIPVHQDVPRNLASADARVQAACCDGEDFELLIAIDGTAWSEIIRQWHFDTPLRIVGSIIEGKQILFETLTGEIQSLDDMQWHGFEHVM